MEIRVTLDTYYGRESRWTAEIRRKMPLSEARPVTFVFNIEPLKDAKKKILVKPRLLFPTGVLGGTGALAEEEFQEYDLSEGKKKHVWTATPAVSGVCHIQLSIKRLNDKDKILDDFGTNLIQRDEEKNRYYSKPVRIYSFYEIMVFFFALISTIGTLVSTYLAWLVYSTPVQ